MLPATEVASLERLIACGYASSFDIQSEGGLTAVVLHDFKLPSGLAPATTDLLLRLPPGFPDAPPDMFWVDPPVVRTNGSRLLASESIEEFMGRPWQRFSRHLAGGEWRPGTDSLAGYVALIKKTLATEASSQ